MGHDTAAALIKDGEVLFAVEEERISRSKHAKNFPMGAIQACLDYARVQITDIDAISLSFIPLEVVRLKFLKHSLDYFPRANRVMIQDLAYVERAVNHEQEIRERLNFTKEIYYCHHHTAHLASSYYLSGFDESALFTIDGIGEIETSVIGQAHQNELEIFPEYSINFPTSIGLLYSGITDYLGFLHHCDEGKVMGLAPYGNAQTYKAVFEEIVKFKEDGAYDFDLDYLEFPFDRTQWVSEKFLDICGPKRDPGSEITQRHMDIAAALQHITEKAMLHTANHLHALTGSENLCLAGGVALNCVANGKVLTQTGFEKIFVQPAAYDAGTAIGAALYYFYSNHKEHRRHKLNNTYLGDSYSDAQVIDVLKSSGVEFYKSDSPFEEVAGYLAEGKIVGWFNGRMEFGPRALGNRSILTAPFPAEMKEILNEKVKHREGFRPFAPSVILEEVSDYFDNSHESPYMLLTFGVLADQARRIPAITHVDGTARVQTVSKEENPDYYKLICEFKRLTGVGVILNTSFNVMGQPIVNKPEEALECFLSTYMDYLVFNAAYIVARKNK
jgi:carbamoyltransferase